VGKKKKPFLHRLNQLWLRYEYKHTTVAIAVLALFVLLFDTAFMSSLFSFLNSQQYVGGFIAGLLSASLITAGPALVLVIELAQHLDPLALAILLGVGSAVGDMVILLLFEDRIAHELAPLGKKLGLTRFLKRTRRRKRMSAPLLLAGAFVIMTPLPDEVGLGLLGISHFPKAFIFVLCLALNTLGNCLLVFTARAVM
jgi:hypothetical protein